MRGMREKGYTRDIEQCHMKIKELWQEYQKTREANGCSGSAPQICHFYEELHAILGGNPTTNPKGSMDTSQESRATLGNNKENIVDTEKEEEKENGRQARGGSILPNSQELLLTLEPIPSKDQIATKCDTWKGTSEVTSETLGLFKDQKVYPIKAKK
ncbi:zinc finger and SCAN domain-containing protein 29-like [Natator depressus]|uniref:zinc finger and SCAN domain-containing protein 29-like n=1 Tax=Natator depressus TaxID=27790 RepID=UPI003EB80B83